ncbi:helix-turn-helix domain-containing protein [Selenomonas ruminantium]|uniref:helix-turn-helix domain-containing protein n=1 Tax=Selenomonas ruminantium TaxID=971 RepID=UPI0026ED9944|nr:helix-turn-helix domain-containing protein [Selenomonas ruminantium]
MAKSQLTAAQQRVALEMSKVGLSQKKIAAAFDVSQPTISNVLKVERLNEIVRQKDQQISNALSKAAVTYLTDKDSSKILPSSK